jgi:hypothetical protein
VVAWVSDESDAPPQQRLGSNGPWFLVDGKTKIFDNGGNLSTKPLAPINQDEHGKPIDILEGAWTGTLIGGIPSGADCNQWEATAGSTATVGTPAYTGPGAQAADWTEGSKAAMNEAGVTYVDAGDGGDSGDVPNWGDCSNSYRLICLESL